MNGENKFDGKKFSDDLHARIHRDIHERSDEIRVRGWSSERKGVLPGLILMVIGTAILLSHMGYISVDRLWRFWPLILIFVGTVKFFRIRERAFGAVLLVIGGIFLSNNLGITNLGWNDLWPIVLIAAGAGLVWTRIELPRLPQPPAGAAAPNMINEYAMFGGVERRISVNNFTGGSATAIFGGVELDFRSADIDGEQAVVYVDALFGGIELVVPDRWTVVYEGQSIFGGYSDETRPPLPDVPGAAPKKRLVIRGRAVFGGISVKN